MSPAAATLTSHFHTAAQSAIPEDETVTSETVATWVNQEVETNDTRPTSPLTMATASDSVSEVCSQEEEQTAVNFQPPVEYYEEEEKQDEEVAEIMAMINEKRLSRESSSQREAVEDKVSVSSRHSGPTKIDSPLKTDDTKMNPALLRVDPNAPSLQTDHQFDGISPSVSSQSETPLLDSALEDFQRKDDLEEFDWRTGYSPIATDPVKRRTDANSLLLPIPSFRQDGFEKSPPLTTTSDTTPRSFMNTSVVQEASEEDEDSMDWRAQLMNEDDEANEETDDFDWRVEVVEESKILPGRHSKRRKDESFSNPLLPVPSCRDDLQPSRTVDERREVASESEDVIHVAVSQSSIHGTKQEDLTNNEKSEVCTSPDGIHPATNEQNGEDRQSAPESPVGFEHFASIVMSDDFMKNVREEAAHANGAHNGDIGEEDHGEYFGLNVFEKVGERTVLPAIPEDVAPANDEVIVLRQQLGTALKENQKLANKLCEIQKSYEERVTPFRDLADFFRRQYTKKVSRSLCSRVDQYPRHLC